MNDRRMTAMVVEDDESISNAIVRVLTKRGIDPITATNSNEALDKVTLPHPNIFIVDLGLEEPDSGFKVIQSFRKMLGPHIPIIVISGNSDAHAITHSLSLGADDFLMKPLDRKTFEKKLIFHLELLDQNQTAQPSVSLPPNLYPGEFAMDVEIREIDELGIKIFSGHVLNMGASFLLDGEMIQKVTGSSKPIRVVAASSWYDEKEKGYYSFLEFDPSDEQVTISTRKWLVHHSDK